MCRILRLIYTVPRDVVCACRPPRSHTPSCPGKNRSARCSARASCCETRPTQSPRCRLQKHDIYLNAQEGDLPCPGGPPCPGGSSSEHQEHQTGGFSPTRPPELPSQALEGRLLTSGVNEREQCEWASKQQGGESKYIMSIMRESSHEAVKASIMSRRK